MTTVDAKLEAGYFVDVRGIRTHVYSAGSGPQIAMIHGSGPGVSA